MNFRLAPAVLLCALALAGTSVISVSANADVVATTTSPTPTASPTLNPGKPDIVDPKIDKDGFPTSVSIKKFHPPVGDQHGVPACGTWAIAYTAMGLTANRQGIPGGPFAPMYVFSQYTEEGEKPGGVSFNQILTVLQEQGIDTKEHYKPGEADYQTRPDAESRRRAGQYKLSGYERFDKTEPEKVKRIKKAINDGKPVVFAQAIYDSFRQISRAKASNYSYKPNYKRDTWLGEHAMTIVAYNDKGITLQNTWTKNWGIDGFANVPWSFVLESYDFVIMGDIDYKPLDPQPTPTPTATVVPTPSPTSTPSVEPTKSATAQPTSSVASARKR